MLISGGAPYKAGCWIGLRDTYGTGLYKWIEKNSMNDISFRDWRRTEVLNRDQTEGFLDNGKRCVHSFPWQEDPAIEEQGSWSLSACSTPRPFVCQHGASTRNFALRVTANSTFDGSAEFFGGQLLLNIVQIFSLKVDHATEIIISPNFGDPITTYAVGGVNLLKSVVLSDGSILRLEGPADYFGLGKVFIGEQQLAGIQSVVQIGPLAQLYFYPGESAEVNKHKLFEESEHASIFTAHKLFNVTAQIAARVESDEGSIFVGTGASLELGQVILLDFCFGRIFTSRLFIYAGR